MNNKRKQAPKDNELHQELKAFVVTSPSKCSSCGMKTEKYQIRVQKDEVIVAACPKCKKAYITPKTYCEHKRFFRCLNYQEAHEIISEREAEIRQKKLQQQEKEQQKIDKKWQLIKQIEEKLSTYNGKAPEYKEYILADSFQFTKSLIAVYLVSEPTGELRWFFVCWNRGVGSFYNESDNCLICNNNYIMGKLLLESSFDSNQSFFLNRYEYKIELTINVCLKAYKESIDEKKKRIEEINKRERTPRITYQKKDTSSSVNRSNETIVYVYFRMNNSCISRSHNVETVTAETTNVKTGSSVKINVYYCKQCNKYFVNYEALQSYINRGIYPALSYKLVDFNESKLRQASELMMYGYNVREGILSKYERQKILSWIIDAGLMTKGEIIRNLQFKVNYNGRKPGNANAKARWQDDIQFVSRYVKDNSRAINAVFVRK